MTRNETVELLAWLALRFPSQKLTGPSIEAYCESLADYPIELSQKAAKKLATTSRWFPSLAEIIGEIAELALGLPTPEGAWMELLERVRDDEWENLDETLRSALRAAGGTHAIATQESHFVRRAFIDAYTALRFERVTKTRDIDLPKLERARLAALPKGRG